MDDGYDELMEWIGSAEDDGEPPTSFIAHPMTVKAISPWLYRKACLNSGYMYFRQRRMA